MCKETANAIQMFPPEFSNCSGFILKMEKRGVFMQKSIKTNCRTDDRQLFLLC